MNTFADYYDALMSDPEATLAWKRFVTDRVTSGPILELACGHGELAELLVRDGYGVTALDLDEGMIQRARLYHQHPNLTFIQKDMRDLSDLGLFEAILCFGDSLNYLQDEDEVESLLKECLQHLTIKGVLLFDMHTDLRLEEFKEMYIEEGFIEHTAYQWTIQTEEPNKIHHTFAFYPEGDSVEVHRFSQTVFDCDRIKHILETLQTEVELKYDFIYDTKGTSEKVFFTIRKQK